MSDRFSQGDRVKWKWGNGYGEGEIASVYTDKITLNIKGSEITRTASADDPAYKIIQSDGGEVLKGHSELKMISVGSTNPEKQQEIYESFYDLVNMQPKELEEWLQTEESQRVGDSDEGEESTGHRYGRHIVSIKRTLKDDLTDEDYKRMQKVVGYIKRHTAQRPDGDIKHTNWRYSLKNWGHDPL